MGKHRGLIVAGAIRRQAPLQATSMCKKEFVWQSTGTSLSWLLYLEGMGKKNPGGEKKMSMAGEVGRGQGAWSTRKQMQAYLIQYWVCVSFGAGGFCQK